MRWSVVVAVLALPALLVACEEPSPKSRPAPGPNAVTLTLESDPPGAAASVDGFGVGLTPTSTRVDPGPHRVSFHLDGHLPHAGTVDVRGGQPSAYKASLIASH